MPTSTVSRCVADLENQLGLRLLERSTRSLRLTDIGSEVLEHAQHSAELSEAVDNIASNHLSNVSGILRLPVTPPRRCFGSEPAGNVLYQLRFQ
jgi:DNA-binding transcriptional LysR family regulator